MTENSLLASIETPADKPIICTICADAGLGKTSFGAAFPSPIFIRAEDGLQSIPMEKRPPAFPVVDNEQLLHAQLRALMQEDHKYKTLVIDSATALDRMFVEQVIASDTKKPKSINQALGGYGAGPAAVASMHQRVRKAAGILRDKKGMHVVFLAHADTETIEPPDSEHYTRYALRLMKKSVAPYVDDVDLVGFIKLETFMKDNKAISDGTRQLITYATAANVSKNRYGITEPLAIPFNKETSEVINPLTSFVKSLQY